MAGKLPLSVTIVTFNEERNLPETLESIADLASEIIIVDSFSTDRTVETAGRYGAKVTQRAWPGFLPQKKFAHDLSTQPWVLNLDADERPSPHLKAAIRHALENDDGTVAAFETNRKCFYMGRWIEHAWCPDWIIRLGRRGKVEWGGSELHPKLIPSGELRRLPGDLLHHPYASFQAHLQRIVKLERVNAEVLSNQGVRAQWHHLLFHPAWACFKKLVLKQSFRDGVPGLMIALSSFVAVFAKYAYLWELHHSSGSKPGAATERVDKNA
jgi:glycosyltransferase involved in cell wall biosynthesis